MAVKVTVTEVGAISVSFSAWFAVMVRVWASGRLMNKVVASVVMVKTPTFAASTTTVVAVLVIVRCPVAFGTLTSSAT